MEIDHLAGLVANDSLYGPTVLIKKMVSILSFVFKQPSL